MALLLSNSWFLRLLWLSLLTTVPAAEDRNEEKKIVAIKRDSSRYDRDSFPGLVQPEILQMQITALTLQQHLKYMTIEY